MTSAFLEAAIVGRPVLTFTLPEYRIHQEEMLHFQYLMTVEGGLLHAAPDLETHFSQLAEAVALGGARDDRNRRFLGAFIRPAGLDVPATPAFAGALERLVREGARPDPTLAALPWLRAVVGGLASQAHTRVGRWLLNDLREDVWDADRERKQRSLQARQQDKAGRQRSKIRRRERRQRRDAIMRAGKEVKSALRRARHRVAITAYRALAIAGIWRGGLPGGSGRE